MKCLVLFGVALVFAFCIPIMAADKRAVATAAAESAKVMAILHYPALMPTVEALRVYAEKWVPFFENKVPGLVDKTWATSEKTNWGASVYHFEDMASAEAWFNSDVQKEFRAKNRATLEILDVGAVAFKRPLKVQEKKAEEKGMIMAILHYPALMPTVEALRTYTEKWVPLFENKVQGLIDKTWATNEKTNRGASVYHFEDMASAEAWFNSDIQKGFRAKNYATLEILDVGAVAFKRPLKHR
jgi:heme-degrading monooxygenase HmoA